MEKSNKDTEVMDLKKLNNSDKFASKDEISSVISKLDRKAEITDLKSLDLNVNEEAKKRKDDANKMIEKLKLVETNLENLKKTGDDTSMKNIENLKDNMGKIENKIAIMETFKKSSESKFEDLMLKWR